MTPSKALQGARQRVGAIHYMGGDYMFNVIDSDANAWRQDYRDTARHRVVNRHRQALIREALVLMGIDRSRACYLISMSPTCDDLARADLESIVANLYREAMA